MDDVSKLAREVLTGELVPSEDVLADRVAQLVSLMVHPEVRVHLGIDTPLIPPQLSTRSARALVKAPPGHMLLTAAEFLFSRKAYEQVFVEAVNDLRDEYTEALAGGRTRKARWVHFRGVASVLIAAARLTLGGVLRFVVKAYRSVTG